MDTRFWGPSGWRLLHRIAYESDAIQKDPQPYSDFFETIPYILPCKFCRSSLTDYYKIHPFQADHPMKWMHTIHNCVNDKLRTQGLHPAPNPPFSRVLSEYDKWAVCPWQQQLTLFWDFLFSVGYHHPKEKQLYASPMPDCPPTIKESNDTCEKNKWNVLPYKERILWFRRFWDCLSSVLPREFSGPWNRALRQHPPTLSTRHQTVNWLWRMRCALDTSFHDPYRSICKRIATYSSDCAVQKGVFTCRRKKQKEKRRTQKNQKNEKNEKNEKNQKK
jgi:hypothetical protein